MPNLQEQTYDGKNPGSRQGSFYEGQQKGVKNNFIERHGLYQYPQINAQHGKFR